MSSCIERRGRRNLALLLMAAIASYGPASVRAFQQETPEEAKRMADSLFEGGFAIDNADPEASVPSKEQQAAAPLEFGNWIMEVGERADRATKRGDHGAAVKFHRALARAFPERSIAHAQLCEANERAGLRAAALSACADAIRSQGARITDFIHYIRLVIAQPADLTQARVHDLDLLLQHLAEVSAEPLVVAQLSCDLGVALMDTTRLAHCAERMGKLASESSQSHVYAWVVALQQRDREAAQRSLEQVRKLSLAPQIVSAMQEATDRLSDPPLAAASFRPAGELLLPGLAFAGFVLLAALFAARAHRAGQQRVAAPTGRGSEL